MKRFETPIYRCSLSKSAQAIWSAIAEISRTCRKHSSGAAVTAAMASISVLAQAQIIDGGPPKVVSGTQNNPVDYDFYLTVGNVSTGELAIESGAIVQSWGGTIGSQKGSTGLVTVTGKGTAWNNYADITVGYEGKGELAIESGATAQSEQGFIGAEVGSTGLVTVTGKGSAWNISDRINVGYNGKGVLTIADGGTVSARELSYDRTGIAWVGYSGSGTITVTGEGSKLLVENISGIGGTGAAAVSVENGGSFTTRVLSLGEEQVDRNGHQLDPHPRSSLTVTGKGSTFYASGANISTFGTMTIEDGATAESTQIFLSTDPESIGSKATLNLLGKEGSRGVLMTGQLFGLNTTSTLNFDGGILRAMRDESAFISGFDAPQTLGAGGLYLDSNSFDVGVDAAFEGAGGLVKQGAGTLTLRGGNSYSGDTVVEAGTLAAGKAGAFSSASHYSINAGATLDLNGFNQTLKDVRNSGTISLQGSTPGTVLTVTGAWQGLGGTLAMGTELDGNLSATDKLLLSGTNAVASGSTSVEITNVGGLGAQTTGKGIEIIATEGGARLENNSFTLAGNHVDAGAFEYYLHQDAQGGYLQSQLASAPPGPSLPTYRDEAALLSAMPAQLRQADMAMLGDMRKRMGDAGAQTVAHSAQGTQRSAWGRVLRTAPRIAQQGSVNPESSGHMTGFQAGVDLYADAQLKAGLYVGQLQGQMHVRGFASGMQGKRVGFNDLRSRYLGVYGTWQDGSGLYADAVVQAADYRSSMRNSENANMATPSTKGSGWTASLEAGKSYAVGGQWQIEPQAQIIYRKLNLDDTALNGTTVQNRADDDWALRLGARIKGSFTSSAGLLQPYGRINFYKSSSTTDVARFITSAATTEVDARGGSTSSELAAGASLQLNPSTSVYGEVGKLWAHGGDSRVKSNMQASVGVRVLW